MAPKRHHSPNFGPDISILGCAFLGFGALVIAGFAIAALQLLIPIAVLVGLGYGIYYLATRQPRLKKADIAQRLQDLKDSIQQADCQTKLLDKYLDEKNDTQYVIVARQLLPKIKKIQNEVENLKYQMNPEIYKRVIKKSQEVQESINLQLEKWDITPTNGHASAEEKDILERAPELTTIYNNIQHDHATILEKIKDADNNAELTALHEADMNRFKDILEGYLKIKESPKDYYNAYERLEQAKMALEKFDLALDETLRRLNESDLKDFDISLRMMKDDQTNL